jgi:hypothetical protein
MNRSRILGALVCAAVFFGFAALAFARADDDKKEKPKGAPTLDDRTGTLTTTVEGKEKESKVDLKYSLKVKGYFANDGFHIEEVDEDGPAGHLGGPDGSQNVRMEAGDIIAEIEGKKIKSADDYVKAMNSAADHAKTKLKVRDVNSGDYAALVADAAKR